VDLSSSPASRVVLPGRHVVDTSTQLRSGPAGISRCLLPASVGVGWVALAPVSDRYLPENQASVRLQEACGFRVVGVRERLGRLHGRWRDVLLMERRSPVVT
jgi:hypothetical protein